MVLVSKAAKQAIFHGMSRYLVWKPKTVCFHWKIDHLHYLVRSQKSAIFKRSPHLFLG